MELDSGMSGVDLDDIDMEVGNEKQDTPTTEPSADDDVDADADATIAADANADADADADANADADAAKATSDADTADVNAPEAARAPDAATHLSAAGPDETDTDQAVAAPPPSASQKEPARELVFFSSRPDNFDIWTPDEGSGRRISLD